MPNLTPSQLKILTIRMKLNDGHFSYPYITSEKDILNGGPRLFRGQEFLSEASRVIIRWV